MEVRKCDFEYDDLGTEECDDCRQSLGLPRAGRNHVTEGDRPNDPFWARFEVAADKNASHRIVDLLSNLSNLRTFDSSPSATSTIPTPSEALSKLRAAFPSPIFKFHTTSNLTQSLKPWTTRLSLCRSAGSPSLLCWSLFDSSS